MRPKERKKLCSSHSSWMAVALAVSAVACGSSDDAPQPAPPPASGSLVTWAGDGRQGHDGGSHSRLESSFDQPMELVFAGDGTAIVVDWNNHCVRKVDAKGTVNDVIGTPIPGDWPCQDPTQPTDPTQCEVPLDGKVAGLDLSLNHPMDVVIEDDGSFVLAAWHNHKIEHYDEATTEVSVLSGQQGPGPDGDGSPATAAKLNFPSSILKQSDGGLLIADERTNRVRRIAPDGTISTVAGVPPPPPTMPPTPPTPGSLEDGVPAKTAQLALTTADKAAGADNPPPGGAIVLGDDGTLFIADTFHHCIRSVAPGADGIVGAGVAEEETITTVAGTCGQSGYSGDGGSSLEALLNQPFDIEIGPSDGALYIADTQNHVVRKVDLASHEIDLVAGTGSYGYSGEALPATESKLREPYGLAFDGEGTLFIVDTMNNRIREIVP